MDNKELAGYFATCARAAVLVQGNAECCAREALDPLVSKVDTFVLAANVRTLHTFVTQIEAELRRRRTTERTNPCTPCTRG